MCIKNWSCTVSAPVLLLVALFTSCGVTRTLTLGNGETISYPFHATQGDPLPVDNNLIRVIGVGPAIGPGNDNSPRAHVWLGFLFEVKTPSIREISITDVTSKTYVPIVNDKQPTLKSSRWGHNTPKILASPENVPWLYQPGDTLMIFRIDVGELNGAVSTFYQPCMIKAIHKRDMQIVMGNIEKKSAP